MLAISPFWTSPVKLIWKLFIKFLFLCSLLSTGNTTQVKSVQESYSQLSNRCMKFACFCRSYSSSSNFCLGDISVIIKATDTGKVSLETSWRADVPFWGLANSAPYLGTKSPQNTPKRGIYRNFQTKSQQQLNFDIMKTTKPI